jgi:integrase
MARRRLSELMIGRIAPPKSNRLELADAVLPGLSLRITPDGTRSFALRYRIDGKQQRLTLGRYDPQRFNLAAARAKARTALDQRDAGKDPGKFRREVGPERGTVADVIAAYVEKRLRPRARRWADVEAMLRRDVVASWGTRPLAAITRRDVRDLIEGIAARGSPVVANRVLSHLRGLFRWAIRNDYVTANPALDVDRPHDEKPRQRTLTEAEIRAVWQAFHQMAWPFGTLGQLLLLTGQRRGEWAGACWSEFDLERTVWYLPASRSKTGEPQMLPLTPQVLAILAMIPRINGMDLIFPSRRAGSENPISGFSKGLATAQKLSGTTGWHWHDLRRTCRTGFARLGITAAVGERILNHSDGTRSRVAKIYDAHSYLPEMRRALELWAAEVERIVSGSPAKVVALHR